MIELPDERDYAGVIAALRDLDKDLEKNLSKRISNAAKPVVADMRREIAGVRSEVVSKDTSGAGLLSRSARGSAARRREAFAVRNATVNAAEAVTSGKRLVSRKVYDKRRMQATSLRQSIARGIRLSNRKSGRLAGVTIRTSGTYLPPDQKGLARAFDRGRWRHPVFGNKKAWVEQVTNPKGWFSDTAKKAKPKLWRETIVAVRESLDEVARRGQAAAPK